jgi:3-hydroxyacyl-CoA dehydrogenase
MKIAVFRELDALTGPDTVIASSTSALLPSAFTETLPGRHRCLVIHPINPPYLVPAVEIVPAPWTSPETVERAAQLMRGAGQAPIVMKRELDGFVMNRLQGALLQEAFRLVADGYASVEDVDVGIRDGLGLRWAFMGPFETIDLNAPGGVADYIARYDGLYRNLWASQQHVVSWPEASAAIEAERRAALPADRLAAHAAWRDRRLMALLAHKRAAAREID